jgi:hypothetical protein
MKTRPQLNKSINRQPRNNPKTVDERGSTLEKAVGGQGD